MNEITELMMDSNNPDYCGCWKKDEVEHDMIELGINSPAKDMWIEWIFCHTLDCPKGVDTAALTKVVMTWPGGSEKTIRIVSATDDWVEIKTR